jgi:hypothetical protein
MTAIFGMIIKERQFGILAADDIESLDGGKSDKVNYINNRFAIGIIGLSTPQRIFSGIYWESNYTIDTLIKDIKEGLDLIIEEEYNETRKKYEAGEIKLGQWELILSQGITLVIIDFQEYDFAFVEFGNPFPPESFPTDPKVYRLENNRFYPFGLACKAGLVGGEKEKFLNEDPIEVVRGIMLGASRKYPTIGELGAFVIKREHEAPFFHSCLNGLAD